MSVENSSLVDRVAAETDYPRDAVEQVLREYGLNLPTGNRRHRSIRLDRLRIRGRKTGDVEPGSFDETFEFGLGVTVIAAGNLRGKTSILEVLTLILRGEPRNLQADVLSWLQEISLDTHINGQPTGFRLSLRASAVTQGRILAGTVAALKESDDSNGVDVAELASANGGDEWAEQVGAFMMTQLGLEEMQAFNRGRREDDAGIIKSHGWPAYFGVLYPPSGADPVLLGSTVADQLPVRLMQVFLDMPEAARSMRVRALAQRLESEFKAEQRRGKDADAAIAKELVAAKARQTRAEALLVRLRSEAPAEGLRDLAEQASRVGERVAVERQAADRTAAAFGEARAARIASEKDLNALRESRTASALFHALSPQFCPRCETAIGEQRRSREQNEHHCAVCDTTLPVSDEDDFPEREAEAIQGVTATRFAEESLAAAAAEAQGNLSAAMKDLRSIDERIARVEAVHQLAERAEAEQELAAADAVVETLKSMTPKDAGRPTSAVVLDAAAEILKGEIAKASGALYSDLSDATRDLAIRFGISELEGIRIKGNGTMDVTKGGGAHSSFSSQSPGERLRLRYALVVALLRIARIRNIAGHPGLLLLDSLKAEEVQDDHAQTLLEGLVSVAADEPGLQILATTADMELAGSVSGVAATIVPRANRTSLF